MCGLTGFLDLSNQTGSNELLSTVKRMADTIRHRGPDHLGVWVDAKIGIALGHCRLSIVDLSSKGHQPMHSACGRYVIVYNGEIYNFKVLRQELKTIGYTFHSNSDTEVILSAISQWGIFEAVNRFIGMFAFALWDRKEQLLYLVRDRLGEKPLYYGYTKKTFLFGSELKALRAHHNFETDINRNALALYLRYAYVPTPYSIYQGIYKLPPGTILTVKYEELRERNDISPQTLHFRPVQYWSAKDVVEHGTNNPFEHGEDEAVEQLDYLLRDAVKLQMVADVPLGAFLSGGVDSSTIVALMQMQSDRPVKTFSIGFNEQGYNEAVHAKAVARHLGTDHTELYVDPKQALAVIPRLPALYDEPFSDSSQIPTFLVSQLARQHVTVALSGDAGDELFGGYVRYLLGQRIWQKVGWMPIAIRQVAANFLQILSPSQWNRLANVFSPLLKHYVTLGTFGDRFHKLAAVIPMPSQDALYHQLTSLWDNPEDVVLEGKEADTPFTDKHQWANLSGFTQRMMYLDLITYLPDDILVKVDRASMGVSLEARVPYLDHRVVEFAWCIPLEMKIRNGQGKWLLRKILYKYVPKELIERPKMGFAVPIDAWLRGPLREWAEELLNRRRLQEEGYFNADPIRKKWRDHLSGKSNCQYHLWDILMFQAWKEYWLPN